jgi:hypothetical protein
MRVAQSSRQNNAVREALQLISHWKAYAAWDQYAPGLDPWGIWSASLRSKLVAIRARLDRDLAQGLSPMLESRTELHARWDLWRRSAARVDARIEKLLARIPWGGLPVLRPEIVHELQLILHTAARLEKDAREIAQLSVNLDLGVSG